jgi:hypothetical protein
LGWEVLKIAKPLQVGVCKAILLSFFSAYQLPDAKLDKLPDLFGDSLMPD